MIIVLINYHLIVNKILNKIINKKQTNWFQLDQLNDNNQDDQMRAIKF